MTSKKDNITCNIKVRQCLYMTKVVHQTRAYLCFPSIKQLFITPPGWDYSPSLRLLPSISSAFPSNLLVLISFFFFYFNYSYITYITATENNLQNSYIYSYITYVFCFLQIRTLQCNTIFKTILVEERLNK